VNDNKKDDSEHNAQQNRVYLESKFGKEIFEVSPPLEGMPLPYHPGMDELFASRESTQWVESCIAEAFALSRERIGSLASGLSRRLFLKASGVVLAAAMLPIGTPLGKSAAYDATPSGGCTPGGGDYTYPSGTPQTDIDAFYTDTMDASMVGLAAGGTIEGRVHAAIALAGGLGDILPGHTVCIKPNCVQYKSETINGIRRSAPIFTNPDVLRYIIRAVVKRNQDPARVFVAERSSFGVSTLLQLMLSGIYHVAMQERVNVLPWDQKPYIQFPLGSKAHYLTSPISVPESIRTFDHFINVPVLKNHELPVEYTLCIKAFVGVLNPNDRLSNRHKLHDSNIPEKVAELNLCRSYTTMNIVDATEIVLSNGPTSNGMIYARPDIVIASKDRVACDSAGVAVLKYHALQQGITKNYTQKTVWQQRQIIRAGELGLGYNNPDLITLRSNTDTQVIRDITRIWSECV